MEKIYLLKVKEGKTKDGKKYYRGLCYNTLEFLFNIFLDEQQYSGFAEMLENTDFVDITQFITRGYDKKQDKIIYYLAK